MLRDYPDDKNENPNMFLYLEQQELKDLLIEISKIYVPTEGLANENGTQATPENGQPPVASQQA